jgi:hypothetical protein
MKNTCILTVFAAVTSLSFAQNGPPTKQVSIQSNGVVVHESAGNEGFVTPVYEQSAKVLTVENWSIPQCIDALRVIDEKIAVLGDTEEDRAQHREYLVQRELVEQRKQYLIAQSY